MQNDGGSSPIQIPAVNNLSSTTTNLLTKLLTNRYHISLHLPYIMNKFTASRATFWEYPGASFRTLCNGEVTFDSYGENLKLLSVTPPNTFLILILWVVSQIKQGEHTLYTLRVKFAQKYIIKSLQKNQQQLIGHDKTRAPVWDGTHECWALVTRSNFQKLYPRTLPSLNNYATETSKTKLHGLSPRENYTDRATAACRRSDCQTFCG
jgi:hypothetical protein